LVDAQPAWVAAAVALVVLGVLPAAVGRFVAEPLAGRLTATADGVAALLLAGHVVVAAFVRVADRGHPRARRGVRRGAGRGVGVGAQCGSPRLTANHVVGITYRHLSPCRSCRVPPLRSITLMDAALSMSQVNSAVVMPRPRATTSASCSIRVA
jgi:hypothetical protein